MSIIHSLRASAAFLSFCTVSQASVLNWGADKVQNGASVAPAELRRDSLGEGNLANRQEIELDCSDDRWQDLLNNNPTNRVVTFCNEWLGIGPTTAVVQYTPTITITTSNSVISTVTTTERTIVSFSTTTTSTATLAPLPTRAPLNARAANIMAVAEDIISSVIASGTTATATSTKNAQREKAESGLANACSCKMVDPTATVTSTFTVPPVYTTVGNRKLIITQITDTITFTASTTTSVTPGVPIASSPPVSAASPAAEAVSSSIAAASSASQSNAAPITTLIDQGSVTNSTSSTASTGAVVTAIPFTCSDSGNTRADQVIDDFRFEYLVLCNTEIVSQDRIGRPIKTNTGNDCTAQCSALNAKTGNTTCISASFTPYTDGRSGGDCTLIGGSGTETVPKPGAVAVVNTGVSSNGDECADLGAGVAASYGPPVDTSAIVASITSAGVAIETPGLVTQTADGGVFETYVSANSTDASGYIHWSWYRVSASSSYWWAVYGTSWACTKTLTQTIVQQAVTSAAQASESIFVTTIINGVTTTIISGSSTRTIIGGGGVIGGPPTFVPASVTSGSGEITTFFSEATATSTGSNGIVPPTAVPLNSTFPQTGALNVSFATSTYFSTASEGVVAPSPSANITVLVSSGAFTTATSGSAFALNSTGTDGVIPPGSTGSTNRSIVVLTSTTTLTLSSSGGSPPGYGPPSSFTNWTYPLNSTGVIVSSGAANVTLSSATFTANSTGGNGVMTPTPGTGSVPAPPFINSTTGGSAGFSTSGSTGTFVSTGTGGMIPPHSTGNVSSPAPRGSPTPSFNATSSISVSGTDDLRSPFPRTTPRSGNSSITSVPSVPASSGVVALTVNSSIPVVEITSTTTTTLNISSASVNTLPPFHNSTVGVPTAVSVFVSSGSANVFFVSSTQMANSTGASGVISSASTSASVNIFSTGGTGNFSISGGTAASTRTGESGIIPPSSANVTSPVDSSATPNVTVSSGAFTTATSNSSMVATSTGTPGVIPPASVNSTISVVTTTGVVPATSGYGPPPFEFQNTTTILPPIVLSTGGTGSVATANSTSTYFSTGTGGIIPPFANSTSIGNTFTNSDDLRTRKPFTTPRSTSTGTSGFPVPSSNGSTTAVSSTAPSSGFPVPSSNISITSQPSHSPTPSLNSTTGDNFTNSDDLRTRNPRSTPRSSSTPVPSLSIPPVSSNGTTVVPPVSTLPPFANSTGPIPPFANSTAPPGTGVTFASVSIPAISLNSTIASITPSISLNSSFPSFTPSISFNSSSPTICPTVPVTVTQISVTTQLITTTVIQIQTVTAGVTADGQVSSATSAIQEVASSVASTASEATAPASSIAASASALPSQAFSPSLESRARVAGQPATQGQINFACAETANNVLNPNFIEQSDSTVPGWTIEPSDPSVSIDSFADPSGNGTAARFSSAAAGTSLTIIQPLTLCPGAVYTLSATTRQANVLANCSVEYVLDTAGARQPVLRVTPKRTDASTSASFTVASTNADAAADLRITFKCDGYGGFSVGDDDGYMTVQTGGISVVKSG